MKAILRLEAIGDDERQRLRLYGGILDEALGAGVGRGVIGKFPARYWVAEITGTDDHFGLKRSFLQGHKDYSHANGVGSRGVYMHYLLDEGKLYEVKEPVSWRSSERYFCRVESRRIVKVSKDEVLRCLKDRSE